MRGADAEGKIDEDEEQTWSGGHVIDAEGGASASRHVKKAGALRP